MQKFKIFPILSITLITLNTNIYAAKEIKIATNNTQYSTDDIQKLAATAVGMGVKEPVNLNLANGNLTISGSDSTQCILKVGNDSKPQIKGVSCK